MPDQTPVKPAKAAASDRRASGITWVLVADLGRARLLELQRPDGRLLEIESFVNPQGRGPEREQRTDRPPRVQESANSARHAIEPHTSLREKSAERFARELSEMLERGRHDSRFDRLLVIAPPQFLGVLRVAFGKSLRDLVVDEIAHEMTTRSTQAIHDRLPAVALR